MPVEPLATVDGEVEDRFCGITIFEGSNFAENELIEGRFCGITGSNGSGFARMTLVKGAPEVAFSALSRLGRLVTCWSGMVVFFSCNRVSLFKNLKETESRTLAMASLVAAGKAPPFRRLSLALLCVD